MLLRVVLLASAAVGSLLSAASVEPSSAPEGVHVAYGDDPRTEASVMWMTAAATSGLVEFGATEALGRVAPARSFGAPGGSVTLHEARLEGLAPGAPVFYRVGSGGEWSPVRSFLAAPQEARPFRFVAFGDHGTGAQSRATIGAMADEAPAFAVLAGDLSYANGDTRVWDRWFREIEPLAASVPLMVAPGNHEDEPALGTAAYRARLALPGEEVYYSFDHANVHFLVLHSTIGTAAKEGLLDDMLQFAREDLEDAARRRAAQEIDFIVVVQHHPLYGNAAGDASRRLNAPLVALEEPLLHAYRVDLLLTAHNHHYERSLPMVAGVPLEEGYVEIVTGGGGRSLYEFVDPNDFAPWAASHARRYHYVAFEVEDDVLRGRVVSTDDVPGETIDAFTIERRASLVAPLPALTP